MAGDTPDASATFSVDLEDGTSGTAESAIDALNKLKRQIDADTQALAAMQRAMRNLQGGTTVNIDQFRKLKAQIDAKKQAIAEAQSAYLNLGGTFSATRRSARPTQNALAELSNVASSMPGPIGGVVSRLGQLRGMLAGGAVVLGIAAIAAALVALAAAAVVATAALLKYGIAQAGARRGELLRLEGLTKMRNWWGVAAGNAGEMQAALDRVSGSTALGRDKLEAYTSELYQMGLRGKNLELALEAAAIKGAVLGDEGAKSAMQWAAGMNMAGHSVKALTDDIKARFGNIAAAQLLDLDVQTQKLRENFGRLFSGLKIEALLKGISAVTGLFSQSTYSGKALKAIVETVFQPMIDAITALTPLVKRFFQGIIIGALLVGIGILTLRNWWRKTFGSSDTLRGLELQKLALYAGAAAVGAMVAAFAMLAGVMLLAATPMLVMAHAVYKLVTWGAAAYRLFKGIEWAKLGTSIVEGIVNGLKTGAKWLLDAVRSLGTGAMQALKSTLGIASPSKAFARLGIEISRGVETGVETGSPRARAAVGRMVDVPPVPDAADAPQRGDRGRALGTTTIELNVGGVQITTSGASAAELADGIERELGRVLEGVAIQLGAMLPRGA